MKNDIHLNTRPGFWIALGVSVFFSGCSLTFLLHDRISHEHLMLFNTLLYQLVPQVLSVFLYTCIAISVILHQKGTGNNRVYETVLRENDLNHAE